MTIPYSTQTPGGMLTIELAQPKDVDAIVDIVESVVAWQTAHGKDAGLPPQPLPELIAKRIERGRTYLARLDGAPAGTVSLGWNDTDAWSDLPGSAVYVYNLMTHRQFAGQAIGEAILRWVERSAIEAGKTSVRLECDADNPALHAYYERMGFISCGEIEDHRGRGARFEKQALSGKSS